MYAIAMPDAQNWGSILHDSNALIVQPSMLSLGAVPSCAGLLQEDQEAMTMQT